MFQSELAYFKAVITVYLSISDTVGPHIRKSVFPRSQNQFKKRLKQERRYLEIKEEAPTLQLHCTAVGKQCT